MGAEKALAPQWQGERWGDASASAKRKAASGNVKMQKEWELMMGKGKCGVWSRGI